LKPALLIGVSSSVDLEDASRFAEAVHHPDAVQADIAMQRNELPES
jgi:hypothetical protein